MALCHFLGAAGRRGSGDLIYPGGGTELQAFVRDVQAGKNVVI